MDENRFWTEGPARLRRALEDRREEIDALAARMRATTDPDEKETLRQELRRLLVEPQPTDADVDYSVFFGR